MNILVISTLFGGGYGAGYSAYKECLELSKKGHKLIIVHCEPNIHKYDDSVSKYYYVKFHKLPLFNIWLLKRDLEKTISKILVENKIDLVYVHSLEMGLINSDIIGGKKIIYFVRSTTRGVEKNKPIEYWKDSIRRFFITPLLIYLEIRGLNWARIIIVKSDLMKRELIDLYGIAPPKIKIVSGGFDKEDFPKISKKGLQRSMIILKKLKKRDKLILFAGRIVPVKGLIYLVDALPNILKSYNIKLFVLGSGLFSNYDKLIHRKIEELNLKDRVIFLGEVPQEEVYKYMAVADLCVVPSVYEPFGMVAIQAANYNLPLIITRSVGAADLLKRYSLLRIVRPHSSKDISEASLDLLSRNRIKSTRIADFKSWKEISNKLEKIFIKELKRN